MLVKDLKDCNEFIAGDGSLLKELLHPSKQSLGLRYSLAYAVVQPGQKTLLHVLKASEVYYILSGKGVMYVEGEKRNISTGQTIYIPPDSKQLIENVGTDDLKFLCIVDPAWSKDDEIILGEAGDMRQEV